MSTTAVVYQFLNCPEGGVSFEELKQSVLRDMVMCDEDEHGPLELEIFKHITISETVQANDASEFGVYDVDDDGCEDQKVIIARDEEHAAQLFFQFHLAR